MLVLDEATSALDAAAEVHLLRNIKRAGSGRTVILVTHRAAVLEACKLRLRPILMTSIAFLLGVVPLMLAEGVAFVALRGKALYRAQVPTRRDSPVVRCVRVSSFW